MPVCALVYFSISLDRPKTRFAARVFADMLKSTDRVSANTCFLSEPPSVRTGLFSLERKCARAGKKENRYDTNRTGSAGEENQNPAEKIITCPERKINHERDSQNKQSRRTAGENVPNAEPGQLRRGTGRTNYHHSEHPRSLWTRHGRKNLEKKG